MRLNHDASNFSDVTNYFKSRARQLLSSNVRLKRIKELENGVIAYWEKDKGEEFVSFFVYPSYRSQGLYKEVVAKENLPVLTVNDCNMVSYLTKNKIDHQVTAPMLDLPAYKLIENFYGDKKASRSQAYLMNHIDEGIKVLVDKKASHEAIEAYCLHPLLQSDEDLSSNFSIDFSGVSQKALILALEYRSVANEYLSTRKINHINEIRLSPLSDVNKMLVADKIQNYKDFLSFHKNHPRHAELDQYFKNWLQRLGVPLSEFNHYQKALSVSILED